MTGPRPLTDATLRSAVRSRVDETSLRHVAEDIEMSWSGLRSFLDGGSPQRRTREKLIRWYYARSASQHTVPKADVDTAIAVLLNYVRDESKPRVIRERRRDEVIDRLKGGDT
jgi:hypothetical protein